MSLTRWTHMASGWFKQGLPGYCAFCLTPGQASSGWCQECFDQLPWNHHACCQCKEPLSHVSITTSHRLCDHCQVGRPAFNSMAAELLFEGPVRELIHDFKFHASPRAGMLLLELMLAKAPRCLGEGLLPVPMHVVRARERGFNQSHWLSEQLGKRVALPVINAECIKQLPSQHTLSRQERAKNLLGAFRMTDSVPAHLTIVDDVVTTGATVQALAEVALQAGAKRVDIWAIARTPLAHS
ncbi:ComF family protein [Halomonas zhaodongensis]|uniref:ComF family protein n=2 Tax=Vreelandella zhaodongensis TaxID=1176240 RepID=A0ABX2SQD9_VREZH|nr:ComF family protein [Halomonas zhaodongensis]